MIRQWCNAEPIRRRVLTPDPIINRTHIFSYCPRCQRVFNTRIQGNHHTYVHVTIPRHKEPAA